MPRTADLSLQDCATERKALLRIVFALLAMLAFARITWLALSPPTTLPKTALTLSRASSTQVPAPSSQLVAARPMHTSQSLEAQQLAAEISLVCPSAAREFLQELETAEQSSALLPPYQLTAHHEPAAEGAITSIKAIQAPLRTAMNGPDTAVPESKRWLVDPHQWFVPEDSPAPEPADPPLAQPSTADPTPIESDPVEPIPAQPKVLPNATIPSPQHSSSSAPSEAVEAVATPQRVTPQRANPQGQPAPRFAPPPLGMPSVHSVEGAREKAAALGIAAGEDPHAELLANNCFPSARTCAKCHEKIYNEWSCSSHAYAQVSPMFHKFEQKITDLSQGTVGYFCQRCHAPAMTSLRLPRNTPLWKQPEVAREGVTCVACHRVNQIYGKVNGERRVQPGNEHAPIYGPLGGEGVAEAIARKSELKLKTSAGASGPGQAIHREGRYFEQLSASEYCSSCHQVMVHPGIKLEVVWEQYRASPAHERGVTCQDCHMGLVPGVASGYETCAIAEVAGKIIRPDRQHANHNFYGPSNSIAHPGIFPFHLKANRWNVDEWLQFDWRAGWGTDTFEDRLADGTPQGIVFPKVWAEADDRYDAREIIEENQRKLAGKNRFRRQIMENGSHVDGPFFEQPPSVGQNLNLHYIMANTNQGHNLPTGSLGAQPQLWANVVLISPRGERLWETGYTDRHGDLCDIHSRDVRAGCAPFDAQLFNLQTMFLITGATGTDREFFLPVNVDIDQLPFLRPGAIPVSVTNHPPFIRMEGKSIAPLGKKKVKYRIPGNLLRTPGRYRLSFRLRSRTEPIYFMDFVGATEEMKRAMNEGVLDVHPYSVEFDVR